MNVVMCKNKHYFDADTYDACPHCGAPREDKPAKAEENASGKQKKGWFWKSKPDEKNSDPAPVAENTDHAGEKAPVERGVSSENMGNMASADSKPAADANQSLYESKIQHSLSTDDVTVPIWDANNNNQDNRFQNLAGTQQSNAGGAGAAKNDAAVPVTESVIQQPVQPAEQPAAESATEPAGGESELRDAIRKASANPDGKTLGFFKMSVQRNEDMREISAGEGAGAASAGNMTAEPPAGWLVCIKGPHFGECFNISAGRNSIGRYASNSIVIERDNGVSREKHAWVTYEPKKREFFIKPGEGSGLTYLNDEMIEESHKLEKMDKIEIGETLLMFVPLCGDDFSWENLN